MFRNLIKSIEKRGIYKTSKIGLKICYNKLIKLIVDSRSKNALACISKLNLKYIVRSFSIND
ncbi:MAG: hypothetical protein U9Q92_01930, partial [archaeon]|nr:hypothetical protein [archaeon]